MMEREWKGGRVIWYNTGKAAQPEWSTYLEIVLPEYCSIYLEMRRMVVVIVLVHARQLTLYDLTRRLHAKS